MPPASPQSDKVIEFDRDAVHVVKCPNCGRTIGETAPVPGAMNRYRCHSCREWTWLMVVAAALTVSARPGTISAAEQPSAS